MCEMSCVWVCQNGERISAKLHSSCFTTHSLQLCVCVCVCVCVVCGWDPKGDPQLYLRDSDGTCLKCLCVCVWFSVGVGSLFLHMVYWTLIQVGYVCAEAEDLGRRVSITPRIVMRVCVCVCVYLVKECGWKYSK